MGLKKSIRKLRSKLYKGGRILGDVNAILSGPTHVVKRKARRTMGGWLGRIINLVK